MGDDDQRDARSVEFFEQAHDFFTGGAVEVAGRFVGEDHRRLHDRGAGDGDALALAAGKLVRAVAGAVAQTVVLERLVHADRALCGVDAGQRHRQRDVFGGGEARHEVKALENEADALAAHACLFFRRQGRDVAPLQPVGAGVRTVEQAEQVEQRRFAGTGRPHHGDVFARINAQLKLAQGMHLAVAEMENALDAGEFDQRWHGGNTEFEPQRHRDTEEAQRKKTSRKTELVLCCSLCLCVPQGDFLRGISVVNGSAVISTPPCRLRRL